jgi:hypothetical protein
MEPFVPAEALSVRRCAETIALTAPLKRSPIGFGSASESEGPSPLAVDHLCPWIPNPDGVSLSRIIYGADATVVDAIINRRREEWKAEFFGVPKEP